MHQKKRQRQQFRLFGAPRAIPTGIMRFLDSGHCYRFEWQRELLQSS